MAGSNETVRVGVGIPIEVRVLDSTGAVVK